MHLLGIHMLGTHTQSSKSWAKSRTGLGLESESRAGKVGASSWSMAWVTSGFSAVSVAGVRTGPGRGKRARSVAGSESVVGLWSWTGSVSLKSR